MHRSVAGGLYYAVELEWLQVPSISDSAQYVTTVMYMPGDKELMTQ